jgi:hypothetical protein
MTWLTRLFVAALLVAVPLAVGAPAGAFPKKPCKLLTKAQVGELLDAKVTKLAQQRDRATKQTECDWETNRYFSDDFEDSDAHLGLELAVAPADSKEAKDTIEELDSRASDIDGSVDRVSGLGDEAWDHIITLYVLSGDTLFSVKVNNFDESQDPTFSSEDVTRQAAELVLEQL